MIVRRPNKHRVLVPAPPICFTAAIASAVPESFAAKHPGTGPLASSLLGAQGFASEKAAAPPCRSMQRTKQPPSVAAAALGLQDARAYSIPAAS